MPPNQNQVVAANAAATPRAPKGPSLTQVLGLRALDLAEAALCRLGNIAEDAARGGGALMAEAAHVGIRRLARPSRLERADRALEAAEMAAAAAQGKKAKKAAAKAVAAARKAVAKAEAAEAAAAAEAVPAAAPAAPAAPAPVAPVAPDAEAAPTWGRRLRAAAPYIAVAAAGAAGGAVASRALASRGDAIDVEFSAVEGAKG